MSKPWPSFVPGDLTRADADAMDRFDNHIVFAEHTEPTLDGDVIDVSNGDILVVLSTIDVAGFQLCYVVVNNMIGFAWANRLELA